MSGRREWISPSDAEKDALAKRIMVEIYPIIKATELDEDYPSSSRRIIDAIRLAENITKDAEKEFAQKHQDKNTHGYFSLRVGHIIASCIACLIVGADSVDEFPPYSAAGILITNFAHAMGVYWAAESLQSVIDDNFDVYRIDIAEMAIKKPGGEG